MWLEPAGDVSVTQGRFAPCTSSGRRLLGVSLSDNSLRGRLRAATTESHAMLDATVGGWRIETASGYGAFLSASAAALTPLELALERAGVADWLPDWAHRTRRADLARDLAVMRLATPAPAPASVPDRDFGAGLLYVLEGSRLGARFLARQVRAADAGLPLAYLTHGEGRDLWRSFVDWLEATPKVGFRTDAAEAGARYGFKCFSDAFERLAPSSGSLNVRAGAYVRI